MSIVIVAFGATVVGFLMMLLIGRGQPVSPAAPEGAPLDGSTDLAWVRGYGVEGFQKMLLRLFSEMGFEPERSELGRGTVDFWAVDPTPIRGGRIYVHGVFADPGVPVDAEYVISLVDTARGEYAGKAVLVTLGRFSDEARDTAKDNPIDLLDGDELAALVKKHLPQAYATRSL
jgi:restriction system protein